MTTLNVGREILPLSVPGPCPAGQIRTAQATIQKANFLPYRMFINTLSGPWEIRAIRVNGELARDDERVGSVDAGLANAGTGHVPVTMRMLRPGDVVELDVSPTFSNDLGFFSAWIGYATPAGVELTDEQIAELRSFATAPAPAPVEKR
jgi:hypothetical protein